MRAWHHLGARLQALYFSRAFALATTFSTVKPNSLRHVPPGAEAPKRFIVTLSPSRPMKRCQPKDSAASTTMRLRTALGSTSSL